MLSFDEKEEVFFDSADFLSSDDSVVVNEDLGTSNLGYEIWMSEPQSVKERRDSFIRGMGFLEFTPSRDMDFTKKSEMTRLDRMRDCSGAVSSSCTLSVDSVENSMDWPKRELSIEGNCMVDELDQDRLDLNIAPERKSARVTFAAEQVEHRQAEADIEEVKDVSMDKKKVKSLWKSLKRKMKRKQDADVSKVTNTTGTPKTSRLKVWQNKKKCMEFTAVYVGQEFHAHEGLIWTMKFSPDGQYLASGGEDGVVRIWRVTSVCTSSKSLYAECNSLGKVGKSCSDIKRPSQASVIIPDTDFQIEELPLQEFRGHSSDILHLDWSNSNCLLSSSKDKTVRLWQVGHDECLGVFHHNNYVTCTQFNPVDENYFISGSIDGKVRIWGVTERRVVHWADARDVTTAICYHPNGKQFAVGSISGTCSFYEASGSDLLLNAEIHIHGKKKYLGNRITGIQFSQDSQKVMITSEDSKIRIFDGIDIVHKYRGLSKSGSQMSASFTSTGRHIISVGEDSHIYVWNYDDMCIQSKQTKAIRSCEHFFCEGVSIAIPWSGRGMDQKGTFGFCSPQCCSPRQDHQDIHSCIGDSERFSLANWLFMDGSFRGSATWPEENLPLWGVPAEDREHQPCNNDDHHNRKHHNHNHNQNHNRGVLSATWGLVIVTAGSDGMIRTFHNYGLPVRK